MNTPRNTDVPAIDTLLARLRGELRGAIARRLAWRLAAAVAGGLWVVLVLDRAFEPSGPVRLTLWSACAAAIVGWVVLAAGPRVLRPIRDRDVLTLLNQKRPREVALIATAIDLRRGVSDVGGHLAERTIREANAIAETLTGATLTRRTSESGWPWFASMAAAGMIALVLARPDLGKAFVQRLALAETPWPRRVELLAEGFTLDTVTGVWSRHAPSGEPAEITVVARAGADTPPLRTVWSRGGGSAIRLAALTRVGAPEQDGEELAQRFRHRLERLDEDQTFTLWGGDATLRLHLLATERPQLADPTLAIRPPDYLASPAMEMSLATLDTLPEGSRITVRGRSTRKLARLAVFVQGTDSVPREVEKVRLLEDGLAFEATLPPLRQAVLVTLTGTDILGLDSAKTEFTIDCVADRPPTVSLALDGVGRAITRDAVIGLVARVNDDHALTAASLHLQRGDQRAAIDLEPPRALPGKITTSVDLISLRSSATGGLTLKVGDHLRASARVRDAYDLAPREGLSSQPIDFEVVTPAELLARLGETQRQLRSVVETLQADTERLAYELGLGDRRLQTAGDPPPDEDSLSRWAAERMLDTRKAARGVIETAERADRVRRQVLANRLKQPALVDRLEGAVVGPLRRVARNDLAEAERLLRDPSAEGALEAARALADRASKTLAQAATSLDSQQTYNEVVSLLRGLIREQRRVNERTSKQQTDRVRSLFD